MKGKLWRRRGGENATRLLTHADTHTHAHTPARYICKLEKILKEAENPRSRTGEKSGVRVAPTSFFPAHARTRVSANVDVFRRNLHGGNFPANKRTGKCGSSPPRRPLITSRAHFFPLFPLGHFLWPSLLSSPWGETGDDPNHPQTGRRRELSYHKSSTNAAGVASHDRWRAFST